MGAASAQYAQMPVRGPGVPASNLPATAPTSAPATPAPASLPAPIAATPLTTREAVPRRQAKVTYVAGLLDVEANNSSLNGILREISRQTGMKITGGVADQRVFGNYGPAAPSTILATLLDGTGSNMLVRETASNAPAELVLTPRGPGPTPPSPSSPAFDNADADLQAPAPVTPVMGQRVAPAATAVPAGQIPSSPQPLNNVLGSPSNTTQSASTIPTVQSVSTDSISAPTTAQPVSGIVDSPNPPPAGGTGFGSMTPTQPAVDAQPSNTVKTPEQIFQELQRLRLRNTQQQQPQSGSSAPASTTPATTSPQPQ